MNRSVDSFRNVTARQMPIFYEMFRKPTTVGAGQIIGLTRVRNESLIMNDLLDHVSAFVDAVVVFDDCSDDNTVEIALNHERVVEVIRNRTWRGDRRDWEETSNRRYLLSRAKTYHPEWLFYFDADERFEGDIRSFLKSTRSDRLDGIRVSLFDAYITADDQDPYPGNTPLLNFRSHFGPERRDILMIWRNRRGVGYQGRDQREPDGCRAERTITMFFCQHYGKAISIQQWEQTCDYYAEHFPKYREKWQSRKGQAVHGTVSDFGGDLMSFEAAKRNARLLWPPTHRS